MKALTLWQPWATLIIDGKKLIETRSRPWNFIGRFAVHASLTVDRDACLQFGYDPDKIPRGVILGTAHINRCVQFPHPDAPPDDYGDFRAGRYGYLLSDIMKFSEPIEARGYQGIWEWRGRP